MSPYFLLLLVFFCSYGMQPQKNDKNKKQEDFWPSCFLLLHFFLNRGIILKESTLLQDEDNFQLQVLVSYQEKDMGVGGYRDFHWMIPVELWTVISLPCFNFKIGTLVLLQDLTVHFLLVQVFSETDETTQEDKKSQQVWTQLDTPMVNLIWFLNSVFLHLDLYLFICHCCTDFKFSVKSQIHCW